MERERSLSKMAVPENVLEDALKQPSLTEACEYVARYLGIAYNSELAQLRADILARAAETAVTNAIGLETE